MKKKIMNRSAVYRAIYYSGFDWNKTKVGDADNYKLTCKDSQHTIYIEHSYDESCKMDFLTVKTTDALDEKELARFERLCYKIKRRTRDLGIHQDLIELKEQEGNDGTKNK